MRHSTSFHRRWRASIFPVHILTIVAMGVDIFDNQDLEAVAETAAELGRWEFLLVAGPLAVETGTGSPINALAIF